MMRQTTVTIAFSAVLGLAGAWALGQWLEKEQPETVTITESIDTTPTIVVTQNVPVSTPLTAEMISLVAVPTTMLPPQSITNIDTTALIGHYTQAPLYAGEILISERINAKIPSTLIESYLEAGMRAMAIPINDVTGVAGFLQPGSRVDVLANTDNRVSLLLTNREVLAVDQTTIMKDDEPVIASTVTLAVTAAETKKLANTSNTVLFLALRNPNEPTPKPRPARAAQGIILQKGMIGRWNRVY